MSSQIYIQKRKKKKFRNLFQKGRALLGYFGETVKMGNRGYEQKPVFTVSGM